VSNVRIYKRFEEMHPQLYDRAILEVYPSTDVDPEDEGTATLGNVSMYQSTGNKIITALNLHGNGLLDRSSPIFSRGTTGPLA
jgi:hypothetical protein